MTDAALAETTADPPSKRSRIPLLLGVVLLLGLGGAGFFATYSGMVFGRHAEGESAPHATDPPKDIAFVALDPIVVPLSEAGETRYLRFAAQLEVLRSHEADVVLLQPRIVDVLNTYLRAVDVSDLSDRTALPRLRAQMLRRVQIVTGEGWVNDLLIAELVLN